MLFLWLPFICHLYFLECRSEWMCWEHLELLYFVPHTHQLLPLKKSSSDAMGLEVSSLDNQYLVSFPLNTIIPLSFCCCALLIHNHYSLMGPSILLWRQVFNKYRLKKFAYKVGSYPLLAHHTILVQTFKSFMQKTPLCRFHVSFFKLYICICQSK